jgi:hypothetical protein
MGCWQSRVQIRIIPYSPPSPVTLRLPQLPKLKKRNLYKKITVQPKPIYIQPVTITTKSTPTSKKTPTVFTFDDI